MIPAIIGPPWRTVQDPRSVLLGDLPSLVACDALAVASPENGILFRVSSKRAMAAARRIARLVDGVAIIYKGTIRLESGSWLWPIPYREVRAVSKIDNPLSRAGFARIVDDLLLSLLRSGSAAEREILQGSSSALNRRWPTLSPAELSEALADLSNRISQAPLLKKHRQRMIASLGRATEEVARLSKRIAGPAVELTLTADQSDIARHIGQDAMVFVTDEYGRRAAKLSQEARALIASGIEQGLSRTDIAADIGSAFQGRLSGRSESYYEVVASSAASRARSYGQLLGYREAEIAMYQWESVLDQATCSICRFLHGQTFPVSSSLNRLEGAVRNPDPEAGVNDLPWYRVVGGTSTPEGLQGGEIYVAPRRGPLGPRVATVRESAVGQADRTGTYTRHASPMSVGGSTMPPAHGRCRCTTIPV